MLCDRSLSVARGCARVHYRIVTVKTCSNGPIDVDRHGCVQFVGEEKRFCTAWVMSRRTRSEHNESGSPPKADVGPDIDLRRFVPILLQKSLMISGRSDSVAVMRFAVEASHDGSRENVPQRFKAGLKSRIAASP